LAYICGFEGLILLKWHSNGFTNKHSIFSCLTDVIFFQKNCVFEETGRKLFWKVAGLLHLDVMANHMENSELIELGILSWWCGCG